MAGDVSYAYFNSECFAENGNKTLTSINGLSSVVSSVDERTSHSLEDQESSDAGLRCAHPLFGVCAPIIDHEIVERKHMFTVFKIQVMTSSRNWFIFRRYSDFSTLNKKLRKNFPNFRVRLPKKRYFGNNYDPDFLSERQKGLQLFLNTLLQHEVLCHSDLVEEFLCLDDPPGPYDCLEESRAFCQQLEETVHRLKTKIKELDSELSATKSALISSRIQHEVVLEKLKEERARNRKLLLIQSELENRVSLPKFTEITNTSDKLHERADQTETDNIGKWSTR